MASDMLPLAGPPLTLGVSDTDQQILNVLAGYKREADDARKNGPNPRDAKWQQNLDLYWGRNDFSKKAAWQAKEVMPEVSSYVDRFAAAMKDALVATPDFYTVEDAYGQENEVADAIKKAEDVWLTRVGRNQQGTLLDFAAVFEEQMKMGALTAASGVVLWKNDVPGGRVAFETVDPRFVWFDPTFRNLYRIRRTEVDLSELSEMAKMTTKGGMPLFRLNALQSVVSGVALQQLAERQAMSGHGQQIQSTRKPVYLDEYIATVVAADGTVLAKDQVIVVANDKFIIRGPENNPFWHGKDWLVYAPFVTAPLSVYGRSYMEDFGTIAKTFNELTNLILDAVRTTAIPAYVMVPDMLKDPSQASGGLTPGKTYMLEDGYKLADFAKQLERGSLDQGAVTVWQNMKNELSEAAGINEVGLGQFAPKGRTSATEVQSTQANSSALVRSVAQTVETRFLDPLLDLTWKTGIQHAKRNDLRMATAVGPQWWSALMARRREFIAAPFTFQARGISSMIRRQQQLQSLLNILQVIAQNQQLMQAFMQMIDVTKLTKLLFRLSNVDLQKMEPTERDRLVQSVTQPMGQAQQMAQAQGPAAAPAAAQMAPIAQQLGISQ